MSEKRKKSHEYGANSEKRVRRIIEEEDMGYNSIIVSENPGPSSQSARISENLDIQGSLAGTINRIYCRNFMCHTALEVKLNSRINFIVGRNGSGKSAILTALVVGLGGKATATNRGSSIKEFVKKGAVSATVEITLNNAGHRSYRLEEYGNAITVVRTINASTGQSNYKLKDEKGRVISTKRDDLEKLVVALNIQVDNPVSILNQQTARTFLSDSDPHEKYQLFVRATEIDKMLANYEEASMAHRRAKSIFELKSLAAKKIDMEVGELKKKMNMFKKLHSHREKLASLENELYWATAIRDEKVLKSLESNLNNAKTEGLSKYEEVERSALKINSLKQERNKAIKDLEEASGVVLNEIVKEVNAALQEEKEKRYIGIEKMEKYKNSLSAVKRFELDLNEIKDELDKIRERSGHDYIATRNEKLKKIEELTGKLDQLSLLQDRKNEEYIQHISSVSHLKEEYGTLESEKKEIQQNINKLEYHLKDLKDQGSASLAAYGPRMTTLLAVIDVAYEKGKFQQKPRGPVGAYIKLKDNSWAPAIESFLGEGTLQTFCVDNVHDCNVLRDLLNRVYGPERKPSITTGKFFNKVHDVTPYNIVSPTYQSLFDALTISDPVVANFLIDSSSIESVMLIPTSDEAYDIMGNAHKVPRNCRRAFTKVGDTFFPDPDYKTYAAPDNIRARFLQTNKDDLVRQVTEELRREQLKLQNVQGQLNDLNSKIDDNRKEYKKMMEQISNIQREKSEISEQKSSIENSLPTDVTAVTALEADLTNMTAKWEKAKADNVLAKQESDDAHRTAVEASEKLKALRNKKAECEANLLPLQIQIDNFSSKVERERKRSSELCKEYELLQDKIKHIEVKCRQQKEIVEKAVDKASELCERIETTRFPHAVSEDIAETKSYIQGAEKQIGTLEEYHSQLVEKRRRQEYIKKTCQELEDSILCLDKILANRKQLYSRIQSLIGLRALCLFQPILAERSYKGTIKFDHENKTLEIISIPKGQQNKNLDSLSGGERSYSTVAFILAMWAVVDPPFYFLDEFDVFMDKINRRTIMAMLLGHAKSKRYQYAFLTPQDSSSVTAGSLISIHRLKDPRPHENPDDDDDDN